MATKKSTNYDGNVTSNAGAGGRGPLGDGGGRTGGSSTSRGTDFTADPRGQSSRDDAHDFIEDAASAADATTGGRDFTAEGAPQPTYTGPGDGADTVSPNSMPNVGDKYTADTFATTGPGARGTGSIGVSRVPFKNLK